MLPFNGVIKSAVAQHITEGELLVWCNSHSENPSHKVRVQFEKLATINTVAGLQARLNNLNHNAGSVDGITGRKTLLAIKQFQQRYNLVVDGDAGPITQKKLKDVHGN